MQMNNTENTTFMRIIPSLDFQIRADDSQSPAIIPEWSPC